jgi:2'-5' RNA ligase
MKYFATALSCVLLVACSKEAEVGDDVIAIDVLLEPNQTMLDRAAVWNRKMRELTPEGFELDESHRPHVTLIQRHIKKDNLDEVLAAVEKVRTSFQLDGLTMTADGLYHIPLGELGLAGITIEPTEELLALQRAVVEAVNPYDAGSGDEKAYVPDPTGTPFDPFLFEYVRTFVPTQTGSNFNPHVTIGLAPRSWLIEQERSPFDNFDFGADGIAVYQLGNFGTASKRLGQ